MKISTVIIAKNEERLIEDCLSSVKFSDEIIVVDSGSIDRTKEIAKKHNARIEECVTDDFSKMRNHGLSKAKGEWILYVDADERVDDDLRESIKNTVLNNNIFFVAYELTRQNYYLGNNKWPKTERLIRFSRKKNLKMWRGKLHETAIIDGKVGRLDGFLNHYSHRNLSEMISKTLKWSAVEAELRFKSGHPPMSWWRFPRVMTSAFFDSYISQGGWRVGTIGIIESMYQAFSIFITYARLWELQHNSKNKNDSSDN